MTKISGSVVISDLSTRPEEHLMSSDESDVSSNGLDENKFGKHSCTENKLPLKKRFGGKLENFHFTNAIEEYTNPWVQMQHKYLNNSNEDFNILKKPEPKKAKILPGVIRHTSCPDNTLAYYYNYSMQ